MGGYFEWDENPLDPPDWPANEAGMSGFVADGKGACPGPEPEPEWVDPESVPDRAERLASRHTRYDGSLR